LRIKHKTGLTSTEDISVQAIFLLDLEVALILGHYKKSLTDRMNQFTVKFYKVKYYSNKPPTKKFSINYQLLYEVENAQTGLGWRGNAGWIAAVGTCGARRPSIRILFSESDNRRYGRLFYKRKEIL